MPKTWKRIRITLAAAALLTAQVALAGGGGEEQSGAGSTATAVAVTGELNESPMLAALVSDGTLPPVEQRLPDQPVVIEPLNETGTYGGTFRFNYVGRVDTTLYKVAGYDSLLRLNEELNTVLPNIARQWEFSPDGREVTYHLLPGIKWSDGEPFTADDILFWWNDVMLNEQLTPALNPLYRPGGQPFQVEKVDDATVRFRFAIAYPLIETIFVSPHGNTHPWIPAHYARQFHADHNANAEQLAKEAGHEQWYQLFPQKVQLGWINVPMEPGLPVLQPTINVQEETDFYVFERNPYYWKVDTAGNQLPYIDRFIGRRVSDNEVMNGKIISGESDWGFPILSDFTLIKENEESGGYRVLPWPTNLSVVYQPNQTTQDEQLRAVFRDVRFRRALSIAMDREEINEVAFFGLGVPQQITAAPGSSYYDQELAKAHIEYDVDEANRLLDEIGLQWDANREWRLLPNGERLAWVCEYWVNHQFVEPVNELVTEYWAAIGADVQFKANSAQLMQARSSPANEIDMQIWIGNRLNDVGIAMKPAYFVPMSTGWESSWGKAWAHYILSNGEQGERPPEEVRNLYDWWVELQTNPDSERRLAAGRSIFRSQAENLWSIGTLAQLPMRLMVVTDNLGNVPEATANRAPNDDTTGNWNAFHPEQFYLKRPLKPGQR